MCVLFSSLNLNMSAATTADASDGSPLKQVERELLNQLIRITLTDGRVIVGHLRCLDAHGNLVLKNARHLVNAPLLDGAPELGDVLAPGETVTKIEAAM